MLRVKNTKRTLLISRSNLARVQVRFLRVGVSASERLDSASSTVSSSYSIPSLRFGSALPCISEEVAFPCGQCETHTLQHPLSSWALVFKSSWIRNADVDGVPHPTRLLPRQNRLDFLHLSSSLKKASKKRNCACTLQLRRLSGETPDSYEWNPNPCKKYAVFMISNSEEPSD